VSKKNSRSRAITSEELEKILERINAGLQSGGISERDVKLLLTRPRSVSKHGRRTTGKQKNRVPRGYKPKSSWAIEPPKAKTGWLAASTQRKSKTEMVHLQAIKDRLTVARQFMEKLEDNVDQRNKLVSTL
jgi:hypothetical protein